MILCHVVQAVVIAVGTDGHVEHQRVHVHDGVQTPAVIRPGAPVGVVQRRAGPCQHSVAGLREAVDLFLDALIEDFADVAVNLVPDRQIAELRLVDTVQSLRNAVDRVVVGLGGDIPLLPLELHQLVLGLDALDQGIPVKRDAGLLFDKLPALLDLVAAMLLEQRIVKLHRLRHGEQRLVEEPVLQDGGGDGSVAGLVGGDNDRRVIGHVVEDEQAGFRLAHRARIARQADGLHRVDVVENGVAVDVAGDEVRDHLHRDVRQLAVPGIEHAAPDGLVVGNVVMPSVVLLAAAEVGVGGEHALELEDGRVDHAAVVPRGGLQALATHAFHAAVEPVQNRQVGLADPAVAPHALGKVDKAAVADNVHDHVRVVVHPDVVEVVHGVFETTPLSVLVQTGLVNVEIAQAALLMGLAVPEIMGKCFHIVFHYLPS